MTQNNRKIAITGGIGSGKSTVAGIIKDMGFPVISCDEIYKELLNDLRFLNSLSEEFGNILTDDGKLDRAKLSSIVFTDKEKLKRLNEITHPEIMQQAISRMEGKKICFCEVPLLFEGGYERLFDDVIVVLRDNDKRISAVAQRDNLSENQVKNRINNQVVYDNLQFEKYYVIHNNYDLTELQQQTDKIIKKINK